MQELEKHKAMLAFFRTNPKIDSAKLNETLDLVNEQIDQLHADQYEFARREVLNEGNNHPF